MADGLGDAPSGFYAALGVKFGAEAEEMKKAYRRQSLKYHPDRNPDDADADSKFKEATEAYEVLSDGEKRGAYDQFGHAGVDSSMGGGGFQGGGEPRKSEGDCAVDEKEAKRFRKVCEEKYK